jgi:hypothetical protein
MMANYTQVLILQLSLSLSLLILANWAFGNLLATLVLERNKYAVLIKCLPSNALIFLVELALKFRRVFAESQDSQKGGE